MSDQYVGHIRPQDHGLHVDTEWFAVSTSDRRVVVVADRSFAFSASHFTATDLAVATHDVELVPRPETVVRFDIAHRGLGVASCGPDTLERYIVGPGVYVITYALVEIGPEDDPNELAHRLRRSLRRRRG